MHQIQKFILAQLMEQQTLRYSQMRPSSMEASQFMYHLKKLQGSGLVVKTAEGTYSLSAKGRQFVDRADPDEVVRREQPRVAALIVATNHDGETLFMRRATQPFVGWVGFPLIDIPIDYPLPLSKYIAKEFNLLTGLEGECDHRADGYIKLLRNGELEGNLLAHVITLQATSSKITGRGDEYFWAKPGDVAMLLPSSQYVLDRLTESKSFFFFEYEHTIEGVL